MLRCAWPSPVSRSEPVDPTSKPATTSPTTSSSRRSRRSPRASSTSRTSSRRGTRPCRTSSGTSSASSGTSKSRRTRCLLTSRSACQCAEAFHIMSLQLGTTRPLQDSNKGLFIIPYRNTYTLFQQGFMKRTINLYCLWKKFQNKLKSMHIC